MKLRRGAAVLMALICCRALGLTEGRSVSDAWDRPAAVFPAASESDGAFDWEELALRYGKTTVPLRTLVPPDWKIGDRRIFYIIDSDNSETVEADGEIVWIGDSLVVWLDRDLSRKLPETIVEGLRDFDERVIPLMHQVFGSEASPGIDGDRRIHALITNKLGRGVLGYFSSRDTVHPDIVPKSNGMEMFMLSDELLRYDGARIVNTLSHEFQHMIHFFQDANEGSNIDEGFSGFAEAFTGERFSDMYENAFFRNPDTSMTLWRTEPSAIPNYGASYLFVKYVSERFGVEFLRPWALAQGNNLDGLDEALAAVGSELSADDVYLDWVKANLALLFEERTENGYLSLDRAPVPDRAASITELSCDNGTISGETLPYGTRFFSVGCRDGGAKISVAFEPTVPLTSIAEPNDGPFFWSGAESNSVASLERTFDLPANAAPIRFSFSIRYDLEMDYDYLYLLASIDNGASWRMLPLPGGREDRTSGFNLGNGLSGRNGSWERMELDLSEFAGERLTLRFDVVTDQAVCGDGVFLDDFRIDAIGYVDPVDTVETGETGWKTSRNGFFVMENRLPLPFGVVGRVLPAGAADPATEPIEKKKDPLYWAEKSAPGVPFRFNCSFAASDGEAERCVFGVTSMNRASRAAGKFTIEISREADNSD